MELTCNQCKTRFTGPNPKMAIANTLLVSTISIVNVRVSCPNPACRCVFISAVDGIELKLAWPAAPPERENKIVLPGLMPIPRVE